jgi:hypothetical protein
LKEELPGSTFLARRNWQEATCPAGRNAQQSTTCMARITPWKVAPHFSNKHKFENPSSKFILSNTNKFTLSIMVN